MARKDLDRLPKISGRMLFLTEEAVQTPLMTMGCALKMVANCRQSGLTAMEYPSIYCKMIIDYGCGPSFDRDISY